MNDYFKSIILQHTGASALYEKAVIQKLWSGYGKIIRIGLENAASKNVIVKHVQLPSQANHPRGWNTDIGHQRKVKSYQVETYWYKRYSKYSNARLPKCLAIETHEEEVLMVLEDLDEALSKGHNIEIVFRDTSEGNSGIGRTAKVKYSKVTPLTKAAQVLYKK